MKPKQGCRPWAVVVVLLGGLSLLLVALMLAGWLWFFLGEPVTPPVTIRAASPSSSAVDRSAERAAEFAAIAQPNPDARSAALSSDLLEASAEPVVIDSEDASVVATAESELRSRTLAMLETFYGMAPDLEAATQCLREWASVAVIDETSLRVDPETGETLGSFALAGIGLEGEFRRGGDGFSVTLNLPTNQPPFVARQINVGWSAASATAQATGNVYVAQHLNAADRASLVAIGDEPLIAGWNVRTNVQSGTHATPILARAVNVDGELSLSVGPLRGTSPIPGLDAIDRAFDGDLSPWTRWEQILPSH